MTSSVTTYTRDQLLDLRSTSAIIAPPPRGVRKTLFSHGLWRPQRACAQHNKEPRDRSARPVRGDRLPSFDDNDNKSKLIINKNNLFINIGCLNACTINGKSASLVNSIVESDLQIFAITETRHETSDDYNIKKITPDGFSCIDRPRPREVARDGASRGSWRGCRPCLQPRHFFDPSSWKLTWNRKHLNTYQWCWHRRVYEQLWWLFTDQALSL